MSEARNPFGKRSITPKSRKLPIRLDLTAMVSISFLLIIFFMLSSYLSRPQAIDFERSSDNHTCGGPVPIYCGDNRELTLLLGKDNKIIYYYGLFNNPIEGPIQIGSISILRKKLVELRSKIHSIHNNDPKKDLIVLIKPSKLSSYGNLVDILDEMKIAGISTYTIYDYLLLEESKLLE